MDSEDFKWKDPQWVAIAVGYESRPADELKAIIYLTNCYRYRKSISLNGFASRYDWSRKKARRFLKQAGVKIVYPENRAMGKDASGYLALLPVSERNPKTKHLRIVTHGYHYFNASGGKNEEKEKNNYGE